MKQEFVPVSELNRHSNLPELCVRVGTYVAKNGMRIPVELRLNENSLIYRLWREEQARLGDIEVEVVKVEDKPRELP